MLSCLFLLKCIYAAFPKSSHSLHNPMHYWPARQKLILRLKSCHISIWIRLSSKLGHCWKKKKKKQKWAVPINVLATCINLELHHFLSVVLDWHYLYLSIMSIIFSSGFHRKHYCVCLWAPVFIQKHMFSVNYLFSRLPCKMSQLRPVIESPITLSRSVYFSE